MHTGKISLLKLVTNFYIGGTERQVANIALGIDASRFDLHLACLRRVGELLPELKAIDLREFPIGRLYSGRTAVQAVNLGSYIRRNGIEVVHTYGLYPNIFAVPVARIAGAPVVIASIRDTGDGLTPAQRRLQKISCRFAHCILVNAEAIRQRLIQEGYEASKIEVIRNGIEMSRFTQARRSGRSRAALGIPESAKLVMVFSRLNRLKGVEYFLEAASAVAARCDNAYFLIVGDGANRRDLEEQARSMGLAQRAIFTGFRCDVPDLLAETDVSVLPSLSEGLSNSLLESMAAGVPAIATTAGGNPEVIDHGVTGLLVPPRDSAALSDAMSRLIADPDLVKQFGEQGKRRVRDLFSVERAVRDTETLYQRLVGQPESKPALAGARA